MGLHGFEILNSSSKLDNLVICQQCDMVSNKPKVFPGHKALCSGCGATLFQVKKNPVERTLAVSLAGLLLFFPALILPLMGLSAAGISDEASLLDCLVIMIDDDIHVIAFSVFMFAIAIPVVRLISAFYISFALWKNKITPSLLVFFRSYHVLDSWAMVHVFFFGVIVSMYKLVSMADLSFGGGLVSLVLLLICSTLISVTLDHHYVWEKMEQALED